MPEVSVSLYRYINNYELEIRYRNEILQICFNLYMCNIEIATNMNDWYYADGIYKYSNALAVFGALVPHYLSVIKETSQELDEKKVRNILSLPNDIYSMQLDDFLKTLKQEGK